MYREGHVGVALLFYAPVGLLAALWLSAEMAVVGGLVAVSLSTLPDIDELLSAVEHRGLTHTVYFALAVGMLVGLSGAVSGSAVGADEGWIAVGLFGFVVGTGTILSHIAADAVTPMGVDPLGTGHRYSLTLVRARNPTANYILLALGAVVIVATAGLATQLGIL